MHLFIYTTQLRLSQMGREVRFWTTATWPRWSCGPPRGSSWPACPRLRPRSRRSERSARHSWTWSRKKDSLTTTQVSCSYIICMYVCMYVWGVSMFSDLTVVDCAYYTYVSSITWSHVCITARHSCGSGRVSLPNRLRGGVECSRWWAILRSGCHVSHLDQPATKRMIHTELTFECSFCCLCLGLRCQLFQQQAAPVSFLQVEQPAADVE